MQVADIMTRKVFTIREDKTVFVANEIMRWAHIRHVPVVDAHDRLVGVISHRDVLEASVAALEAARNAPTQRRAVDPGPLTRIMHRQVHTTTPTTSVQEAAATMRRLKIGCLPVLDDERLVGIVTAFDIIHLVEQLPSAAFGAAAAVIGRG